MKHITIAIDGPAASGKSTVGAILAQRLGYLYFDTGVMYRAVAWAALDRAISVEDDGAVSGLAEELRIEVTPPGVHDGRQYSVFADGRDVTWEIRSNAVNKAVSPVSAYRDVRLAMTAQQRRIAQGVNVVMVGRDIGTVVLPEATVKIYLDATPEERARRRYREMLQRGQEADYSAVLADLKRRDAYDSSRAEAPLMVAPDAIVLDSTELSIEQVVVRLEELVRQAVAGLSEAG